MSTTITLASQFLQLSATQRVNVTTRAVLRNGDAARLTDLTVATVRLWLQVAKAFENGERKLDFNSPEATCEVTPYTGDPAVTVWGALDSADKDSPSLAVHSCVTAQAALNVLWSNVDACQQIRAKLGEQPHTPPPVEHSTPPAPAQEPQSNGSSGVRHLGDFDPKVNHLDGDVLSFNIVKVQRRTNDKGQSYYRLVSTFKGRETQYPSDKLSVREDDARDMDAVGAELAALNLELGRDLAVNWRYVVKVRNGNINAKTGKPVQYFNPVRIEKA